MTRPAIDKISRLIDALIVYADNRAQAQCIHRIDPVFNVPGLVSADALFRLSLVPDPELAEFLASDTEEAKLLRKSLQSFLKWHGQNLVDKRMEHLIASN